jgi:hypothetical protein
MSCNHAPVIIHDHYVNFNNSNSEFDCLVQFIILVNNIFLSNINHLYIFLFFYIKFWNDYIYVKSKNYSCKEQRRNPSCYTFPKKNVQLHSWYYVFCLLFFCVAVREKDRETYRLHGFSSWPRAHVRMAQNLLWCTKTKKNHSQSLSLVYKIWDTKKQKLTKR